MTRTLQTLRNDAQQIWRAGVEAVRADRLVTAALHLNGRRLTIGEETIELDQDARVLVVGGGKAAAGMALGVERALQPLGAAGRLQGWLNVPADGLRILKWIHLHAARPPGVNEPTPAAVAGS